MHSEVLGVLILLLASHQLTAPFMACSRCWFYDRAVSYSYVNELGGTREWECSWEIQRNGSWKRKEGEQQEVRGGEGRHEAHVLMPGFSSHVSQAVGREKGACLWVFVLSKAVGHACGEGRRYSLWAGGGQKAMSTEREKRGKEEEFILKTLGSSTFLLAHLWSVGSSSCAFSFSFCIFSSRASPGTYTTY